MIMKYKSFTHVLSTFTLISLSSLSVAANETTVATTLDTSPTNQATPGSFSVINPAQGSSKIALLLNDNINPIMWQSQTAPLRSQEEVTQLYAKLYYRPLWTVNGRITPLAAEVIETTKNAYQHALRPEVYHTNITSELRAGQKVDNPEELDIIITDAFITLKKHLTNGIVNPKAQFKTWNTKPEEIDFVTTYRLAEQRGTLGNALSIDDTGYQVLKKAYTEELTRDKSQIPPTIRAKKLKKGNKGEAVRTLRARLGLSTESNVYDAEVKAAVKQFQEDHGLQADGVAGRHTIDVLNQAGADHTEKLAINLERHRWSHTPKNENYVWINIPGYLMAVRNNDQWLFETKTVVGRYKRQTPIFSDTLESVVMAPYWNVPKTIFNKDKLPKLRNNPNAFGSSMQVINNSTGAVVSADTVDWENGGKGYRLRQRPGARNALGRVKFLFPNRHAIYMHDTPSKRLFNRDRRAYSSGCIRLQRAEDFALFLLEDSGYDRKRFKRESRSSREKWVGLDRSKQYRVFINYFTAWADDSNNVRYSSDVYRYDKKMSALYQKALQSL